MNMLMVNPGKEMELAALNAGGDPLRQLAPARLQDGVRALSVDLLEDCDAGETWEYYREFLESLPSSDVSANEFEETQLN